MTPPPAIPEAVQALVDRVERALKDAWLDGFRDEHVRDEVSAWRHSATRTSIDDVDFRSPLLVELDAALRRLQEEEK